MSDESLREREREVARSGEVEARLRLAQALERSGRDAEAWTALIPIAHHPAARSRVERYATWSAPDADAGRTRWLDVAPLASRPGVRLLRGRAPDVSSATLSLAGATGLASIEELDTSDGEPDGSETPGEHPAVRRRTIILDPLDGTLRVTIPAALSWRVPGARLAAHEAWDESSGTRFDLEDDSVVAASREGELLLQREGHLQLLPGLHEPPVWSAELQPHTSVRLAGPLVVLMDGRHLRALDRASGLPRWSRRLDGGDQRWLRCDGRGVVVVRLTPAGAGVEAIGPDGVTLWELPGPAMPVALGPDAVVTQGLDDKPHPVVIDRTTGAVRSRPSIDRGLWPDVYGLVMAGDVCYWPAREASSRRWFISAATTGGEALWTVELPARATELIPGPGRLWASTSDGQLLLLAGSDTA